MIYRMVSEPQPIWCPVCQRWLITSETCPHVKR